MATTSSRNSSGSCWRRQRFLSAIATARGYHRVLRVARTLADLDGIANVRRLHIAEALSYRRIAPGR